MALSWLFCLVEVSRKKTARGLLRSDVLVVQEFLPEACCQDQVGDRPWRRQGRACQGLGWRCDKVYCGKPEIKGHGVVRAILLSHDINVNTKNCSWPAVIKRSGGLKKFCLDHADKIFWVETSGRGHVELVEAEVMPSTPSLESAAHFCCNACTFKTTRPAVKCRDGSKCTEKT
mmetsp:Transcript_68259/g.110776  ORF Transcript_68259/g.110776 Transcript_68259/m.110776 type:complete len:174 (-) Transcript_68259:66-587(-)